MKKIEMIIDMIKYYVFTFITLVSVVIVLIVDKLEGTNNDISR